MKCRERMEQYLRENGVPYEVMKHDTAYTMQEAAAALHVSGKQVAKVVMVLADGRMTMLVIPSSNRLHFAQVRAMLGAQEVNLAKEGEFADLFPDCAPGAMPPFGNLYDVPVYVDQELTEEQEIVFRIGTHQEAMKVGYADYARLVQPTVGDFAYLR